MKTKFLPVLVALLGRAGTFGCLNSVRSRLSRGGLQSNALCAFSLILALSRPALLAAQNPIVTNEFIYEQAPFPSCHASTIVETDKGELIAAWFGGTAEKNPDVGIWVSRFEKEKNTWTTPVEVANGVQPDGPRVPTWNPVLFQPRGGAALMLFYKVGPTPETWWGELRTSTDGGRTWSAARRLPDGIFGPIKNKPVQLADGTILSPTSDETPEKPSKWRVYFERSNDGGQTWTKTPFLNDGLQLSAIQPSILFHDRPGSPPGLQAVGRTRQGKVFTVSSDDSGKTWGEMSLLDVPNPSAGTDAVTLRDRRHLLVCNPVPRGRTPLAVFVSDNGRDWKRTVTLENEPGEYSYPAIIQTADGQIHITYTWKRQRIKHVVLNPLRLEPEMPEVPGRI
jgi:predicted neuraminidase